MATNERQQRRRRIMEKGSDRMALITGQIKYLDQSTAVPHHHSHTESSPSILSTPHFLDSINGDNSESREHVANAKMVKMRTISESQPTRNIHVGPQIPKTVSERIRPTPPMTTLTSSDSPNTPLRVFSSKRINQNIICSETTRAISSLVIALLVVAMSSDSFIGRRPFYIIVLTDVTIVVALLFCDTKSYGNEVEERRATGGDNMDDAFKLLERGLLCYQAVRALFVDCSIYLVVVISGLSLF